jgi:hypothetical protein
MTASRPDFSQAIFNSSPSPNALSSMLSNTLSAPFSRNVSILTVSVGWALALENAGGGQDFSGCHK